MNDETDLPFNNFTDRKKMTLALALKSSSLLSIIGSTIVLRKILHPAERRAIKLNSVYHRIVFFVSLNDIIASTVLFLGSWPIPHLYDDDWIWGNVGNIITCDIQGYFIQSSSIAVTICVTFISIYFLLFVRYNWSDLRLKKIERLMHGLVLSSYGLGFLPLLDGGYNATPLFCWIQSYPFNCEVDENIECERGKNAIIYRMILLVVPTSLCILVVAVSMRLLYASVREQETMISRYTSRRTLLALSSRSRNVFIQAMMFVLSYTTIWIPGIILVISSKMGRASYEHYLMCAVLIPLQGFFNAIIYTRVAFHVKDYIKRVSEIIRRHTISCFRISSEANIDPQIVASPDGMNNTESRIDRHERSHSAVRFVNDDVYDFSDVENDERLYDVTVLADGTMAMEGKAVIRKSLERAQIAVDMFESKSELFDEGKMNALSVEDDDSIQRAANVFENDCETSEVPNTSQCTEESVAATQSNSGIAKTEQMTNRCQNDLIISSLYQEDDENIAQHTPSEN